MPSAQGGSVSPGALHKNGMVDLRNADSNTAYFQYDKRAVCIAAGGTTTTCDTAAIPASPTPWGAVQTQAWHSGTAVWRQETSGRADDLVGAATVACNPTGTGCSKGLDRFCISCHDANGASAAYLAGDAGATAGNPFKDGSITERVRSVPPSVPSRRRRRGGVGRGHRLEDLGLAAPERPVLPPRDPRPVPVALQQLRARVRPSTTAAAAPRAPGSCSAGRTRPDGRTGTTSR